MGFWDDWEAWKKMVFVLACAIVIVIILGFGVLFVNKWKLRMYTRAETQEAERARNVYLQHMMIDDAPFGARALETGVQVEGIWTPHHGTPVASPYPSGTPVGSRPPSPPNYRPVRPEPRPLSSLPSRK